MEGWIQPIDLVFTPYVPQEHFYHEQRVYSEANPRGTCGGPLVHIVVREKQQSILSSPRSPHLHILRQDCTASGHWLKHLTALGFHRLGAPSSTEFPFTVGSLEPEQLYHRAGAHFSRKLRLFHTAPWRSEKQARELNKTLRFSVTCKKQLKDFLTVYQRSATNT